LGQSADGRFGRHRQALHLHARTHQQGFGAILLLEHGQQHMHRLNVCMVASQGDGLRIGQGFVKFGGEFVKSHEYSPFSPRLGMMADFQGLVDFSGLPKIKE
jgi:hypothetical protein